MSDANQPASVIDAVAEEAPAVTTQPVVVALSAARPLSQAQLQPQLAPRPQTDFGVTASKSGSSVAASLARVQLMTSRALAETAYQVRRLGGAAVAGIAAVVLAATLFIASNLPQGAAVSALKSQLIHLGPLGHGGVVAGPGGVILAALPSRGEAPNVVAKIREEARASGVELPRGQYEFVPARDGVAARYRMTFPVRASYPKLREFMDRTLVALPAVAVEGLRIERKNVGDDTVDAELKLSAYVRREE